MALYTIEALQPKLIAEPPSPRAYYLSMPHHAMFTVGALQAVLATLWWLIDLCGRYGGWYAPVTWSVPPAWAHLFLMVFGLFPPFMFGFLMTTYPRWMSGLPVSPRHYLPAAGLLAGGLLLTYAGLLLGKTLLLVGLLVYAAGWGLGLYALLRVYASAQRPDVLHARITSGVMALGLLLLVLLVWGIATENATWVGVAREGGIWWFLLPVFFAVSHRLIPFFTQSVIPHYTLYRPDWMMGLIVAGGLLHGALAIGGLPQWFWLADLPMAGSALWLSWRWQMRRTFGIRILAMLHVAFVWVGLAPAGLGLQSLSLLLESDFSFGRGPLHALLIGYFASMLVAMATRVTLGHSGQPLVADNQAWGIFLAIQLVALCRVCSEISFFNLYQAYILSVAALIWVMAFTCWAGKFLRLYWK